MASLLIANRTVTHPDPIVNESGTLKRGDVIAINPDGFVYGRMERLPDFIEAQVSGLDEKTIVRYKGAWRFESLFNQVGLNTTTDVVTIEMSADTVGANNEYSMTEEIVAPHLGYLGMTLSSSALNSVTVESAMFDVYSTGAFWGIDETAVSIVEDSYKKNTGLHKFTATSTKGIVNEIAKKLVKIGGSVSSQTDSIIEGVIHRNNILPFVYDYLESSIGDTNRLRRYHISEANCDEIVSLGGVKQLSEAELTALIIDKTS